MNVSVNVINSSSISLSWEPPDVNKRNGKIVSYTVCLAQWQNVTCLRNFTTESQSLNITKLKPLTKYYARVSASTKAGNGNYSESQVAITNESMFFILKVSSSHAVCVTSHYERFADYNLCFIF